MREPESTTLIAADVERMRAIGAALGAALARVNGCAVVIAIRGELGAGKTTLVGGVLNALGFAGPARSPTYTLIEPYETAALHLYHLDLYRLSDASEVEALGSRDLLSERAVLLVEWPERGTGRLPGADLQISINYGAAAETRVVRLAATTSAGSRLLDEIALPSVQ